MLTPEPDANLKLIAARRRVVSIGDGLVLAFKTATCAQSDWVCRGGSGLWGEGLFGGCGRGCRPQKAKEKLRWSCFGDVRRIGTSQKAREFDAIQPQPAIAPGVNKVIMDLKQKRSRGPLAARRQRGFCKRRWQMTTRHNP